MAAELPGGLRRRQKMTNYERIQKMMPSELAEKIELIIQEAARHPKTFDGIHKKDILDWLGREKDWLDGEEEAE
jgi:hypothetical protein